MSKCTNKQIVKKKQVLPDRCVMNEFILVRACEFMCSVYVQGVCMCVRVSYVQSLL